MSLIGFPLVIIVNFICFEYPSLLQERLALVTQVGLRKDEVKKLKQLPKLLLFLEYLVSHDNLQEQPSEVLLSSEAVKMRPLNIITSRKLHSCIYYVLAVCYVGRACCYDGLSFIP